MSGVIDAAKQAIAGQLVEVDGERQKLINALAALDGKKASPGRPRGSGKGSKPKAKGKRKSGTRADQAVKLVADKPGITASEIAKQLKIKPNYLYRVLGDLEKEGLIEKDGRSYNPPKGS